MAKSHQVRYEMIETTEYVEDSGLVTTYGICCREGEDADDDTGVGTGVGAGVGKSCSAGIGAGANNSGSAGYQVVPNISTESDFVEDMIEKLMQNKADPVHLKDLILDHLP